MTAASMQYGSGTDGGAGGGRVFCVPIRRFAGPASRAASRC